MTSADPGLDDVLRAAAPRVLGILVRRSGGFDACEDAVQEALLAASLQWPVEGVPDNPTAWLLTVAGRRLTDELRRDTARRRREDRVAAEAVDDARASGEDDTLGLLFLCCHPALSPSSQVALTLRAVGGLNTAQIASAFLVPEATMAQRISRAKARIKAAGGRFELPAEPARGERLQAALHVLYLVFNEGYTTSSGPDLQRTELTTEAIRLARLLLALLPGDGEVSGLLALMLLTDAHRPARTDPRGGLVPLAEQDRSLWDRDFIAEGVALVTHALSTSPLGPYQVQAAISAVHAEAASAELTDWPQVLALYGVLARLAPNPMVTLNRAVASAMVDGPAAGLLLLEQLSQSGELAGHHRLAAVRAHLLELAGDTAGARATYLSAARAATSLPEQRYLQDRATRLAPPRPKEPR